MSQRHGLAEEVKSLKSLNHQLSTDMDSLILTNRQLREEVDLARQSSTESNQPLPSSSEDQVCKWIRPPPLSLPLSLWSVTYIIVNGHSTFT